MITPKQGSFLQKYTDDDVPTACRYPKNNMVTPFGRKIDTSGKNSKKQIAETNS
jgi:hypothetical protein